ncbi:MOSC domain-containing protein [Salinimonas marina]|uniref:MOSC domain-containing protein n=1 Tax=Salinimonas marina TaxID=2785918 RepID=A0A7S9DYW2_9ALTE|nr:MOSC domain-containing protein [Salinimonas marina]QPG05875.1 MOSC domain-containing protein [Salinimonas marina]
MTIFSLYAGQPAPLGPRQSLSAIVKQPVSQLTVNQAGTNEDQQANTKLHGGPEKVLHQFSFKGYEALKQQYPELTFAPGMMGENLLVENMDDTNVFIGDIYQMGDVVVQVSAPRAPCVKICHRFDHAGLDKFVGNQGITGWYYRVKQPGVLRIGDTVKLLERNDATVAVGTLMQCVFNRRFADQAATLSSLAVLDDEWRGKCARAVRKANL